MIQWLWNRWAKSRRAGIRCSTMSSRLIRRTCSLRVRRHRSTHPLPSGSRAYDGLDLIPGVPWFCRNGIGDERAAVTVPECDAFSDPAVLAAPGRPDGMAKALDGFESCSTSDSVSARAFAGAVIDDDEGDAVSLSGSGEACGGISGPRSVGWSGAGGAAAHDGSARRAGCGWCREIEFRHRSEGGRPGVPPARCPERIPQAPRNHPSVSGRPPDIPGGRPAGPTSVPRVPPRPSARPRGAPAPHHHRFRGEDRPIAFSPRAPFLATAPAPAEGAPRHEARGPA